MREFQAVQVKARGRARRPRDSRIGLLDGLPGTPRRARRNSQKSPRREFQGTQGRARMKARRARGKS